MLNRIKALLGAGVVDVLLVPQVWKCAFDPWSLYLRDSALNGLYFNTNLMVVLHDYLIYGKFKW